MSSELKGLKAVARIHGVVTSYRGYDRQLRYADEATLRSILLALGNDPDEPLEALRLRKTREHWQHPLPPVCFCLGDSERFALWITLPKGLVPEGMHYLLKCESGSTQTFAHNEIVSSRCVRSKDVEGVKYNRYLVEFDSKLDLGYHRLTVEHEDVALTSTTLICHPASCYLPECLQGERKVWGVSAQVYSILSDGNWGVGDLSDLHTLVDSLGSAGASFLGLSPMHALSFSRPSAYSPYSPTSRVWLNPFFINVTWLAERIGCSDFVEFARRKGYFDFARAERANEIIDYSSIAEHKVAALAYLFEHFESQHLSKNTKLAEEFAAFVQSNAASLQSFAVFEALGQTLKSDLSDAPPWQDWPEQFRNPNSAAVKNFSSNNGHSVRFQLFLQWAMNKGLKALSAHSNRCGLNIGLYFDLAVGADPGGADVWANQSAYALGASVGAPPDAYNHLGQDWGFCPMKPETLRGEAYESMREMLGANMRFAGALRIDHVMSLMRLYLVPKGSPPHLGTYIRYPLREMLAVLALESVRHKCLVIGEDLGVVPDSFRDAMSRWNLFSYRVFLFMKYGQGDFIPQGEYPQRCIVTTTTHDLPTAWMFWNEGDLKLKRKFNLFLDPAQDAQLAEERYHDRRGLLHTLRQSGYELGQADEAHLTQEALVAMYRFLWESPAKILAMPFEELAGLAQQSNLPGVPFDYPSWRVRTQLSLSAFETSAIWSKVRAFLGCH
ncbi:MAG: 4-alpha-glucanotransferase [Bdellovibrionales bacterium]|nr:4-alpha-glucanotransferase [Bdellovibrionales bacterium]